VSRPTSPFRCENVQGDWWLPTATRVRRSGAFSVTDGGVRLHLQGRLGGQDGLGGFGLTPVLPVIHGHLESGKDVTLAASVVVNTTQTILGEGADHSELSASEAFIGAHLDDPRAVGFSAFSITFPNLLKWAAITGITESLEEDGPKLRRHFSYARPDDRVCELEDGARVTIRSCSTLGSGEGDTRVAIAEWGVLIVEPTNPSDLRTFRQRYERPLARLLTFAHDEQVDPTQLAVRFGPDEGGATWIEAVTGRERLRELKQRAGQDHVVSGRDEESFRNLVRSWMSLHERFRIPLDVHFAHAYEEGTFLERQLTEAVQALEGLDRIANPVPDGVIAAHAQDLAKVTELLVGEHKRIQKLVGRLKYAYEPNLADRLRRQLGDEQTAIPLTRRSRNTTADRIARTRNLLTHLDSERERPTFGEMFDASATSTTLAKLLILRELGVGPEDRRRICRNRAWHTPGGSVEFVR
jgi:ApeA-like protein/HEPN superfamily Apea-like protein